MAPPADHDPAEADNDPAALLHAILEYQNVHRAWMAAPDATRAHQRTLVTQSLEALWPLLAQALASVARSWTAAYRQRSPGTMPFAEAVADWSVALCIEVIETLPRLTFEAGRNPGPLLRTIARRRSMDEYRRWSRATNNGEKASPAPEPAEEPQPAARFREIALDDRLLSALADTPDIAGGEFEAALIEQLDRRELFAQVVAYWNRELTAEDWVLVTERYLKEPETPYEELIELLGEGWTSVRARKRLSRILERTAKYVQTSR
jgi:DNA-directed RNA polymerase specialized sigma24 family protein